jgi:hypothetical protein
MSSTITVGTSLTTLIQANARYSEFLGFQITNGDTAFNAFQVQARMEDGLDWVAIKSSGFTDATGFSPAWATAELATLGTSTSAILYVLGKHPWEVRLQASVASGTSSVVVSANSGA